MAAWPNGTGAACRIDSPFALVRDSTKKFPLFFFFFVVVGVRRCLWEWGRVEDMDEVGVEVGVEVGDEVGVADGDEVGSFRSRLILPGSEDELIPAY